MDTWLGKLCLLQPEIAISLVEKLVESSAKPPSFRKTLRSLLEFQKVAALQEEEAAAAAEEEEELSRRALSSFPARKTGASSAPSPRTATKPAAADGDDEASRLPGVYACIENILAVAMTSPEHFAAALPVWLTTDDAANPSEALVGTALHFKEVRAAEEEEEAARRRRRHRHQDPLATHGRCSRRRRPGTRAAARRARCPSLTSSSRRCASRGAVVVVASSSHPRPPLPFCRSSSR